MCCGTCTANCQWNCNSIFWLKNRFRVRLNLISGTFTTYWCLKSWIIFVFEKLTWTILSFVCSFLVFFIKEKIIAWTRRRIWCANYDKIYRFYPRFIWWCNIYATHPSALVYLSLFVVVSISIETSWFLYSISIMFILIVGLILIQLYWIRFYLGAVTSVRWCVTHETEIKRWRT